MTLKTQATFYQPSPFYTAQNFLIFRHHELDEPTGLVLVAAMRKVFQKFSWGYGISMARLARMQIVVPVKSAGEVDVVDWDATRTLGLEMQASVGARGHSLTHVTPTAPMDLDGLTFRPRKVVDLFRPHKGRRLIQAHRKEGDTPFVAGSALNNSITGFSRVDPLFPGGWLTLVYNGSVGRTRFQPAPFFASDDVIALEPLNDNASENALLFCAALIEKVCVDKFSYGVKLNLERLAKTKIVVPIRTSDTGEEVIDWEGMDSVGRWMRSVAEAEADAVLIRHGGIAS